MTGNNAQMAAWIVWILLMLGATFAVLGLVRGAGRFRQWRRFQSWRNGEVVLAESLLHLDQEVRVAAEAEEGVSSPAGMPAKIVALRRKTLVVALEAPLSGARDALSAPWPFLGASLTVSMYGPTALYCFSAAARDMLRQISPESGQEQWLVTLPRPLWMDRIQRRRHARVSLQMPATFEQTGAQRQSSCHLIPDAAPTLLAPIHGTVLDLSGGGLCADVGRVMGAKESADLLATFAPGTILQVRLPVPSLSEKPLLARVRASERTAVRGGLGLRLACEFLPLPPQERELILQQIHRVQQEEGPVRAGPIWRTA